MKNNVLFLTLNDSLEKGRIYTLIFGLKTRALLTLEVSFTHRHRTRAFHGKFAEQIYAKHIAPYRFNPSLDDAFIEAYERCGAYEDAV